MNSSKGKSVLFLVLFLAGLPVALLGWNLHTFHRLTNEAPIAHCASFNWRYSNMPLSCAVGTSVPHNTTRSTAASGDWMHVF